VVEIPLETIRRPTWWWNFRNRKWANLLYQQIEMLSREKHIEPAVVISAIEDAMVVAARKFYKTEEDLRAKFNAESARWMCFRCSRWSRKWPTPSGKSALRMQKRKIRTPKLARKS